MELPTSCSRGSRDSQLMSHWVSFWGILCFTHTLKETLISTTLTSQTWGGSFLCLQCPIWNKQMFICASPGSYATNQVRILKRDFPNPHVAHSCFKNSCCCGQSTPLFPHLESWETERTKTSAEEGQEMEKVEKQGTARQRKCVGSCWDHGGGILGGEH